MRLSLLRVIGGAVIVACGVVTEASQTAGLDRVMRDKLAHSQQLLAAVITSRWAVLEEHSLALQQATREPAWQVLNSPEYARQTGAFVRALDDLVDAAKRRDLEAAPLAYVSMTLSCVQCHRYVARMRLAHE